MGRFSEIVRKFGPSWVDFWTVKCPEGALGARNENSTKFKSLPEYSGVGLKNGSPVLGRFCGPKQAEKGDFRSILSILADLEGNDVI